MKYTLLKPTRGQARVADILGKPVDLHKPMILDGEVRSVQDVLEEMRAKRISTSIEFDNNK